MIRRAVDLFLAGLIAGCAVSASPAQEAVPAAPSAAPQLAFDATDVNLGDIVRGQDAVATFSYHNNGSAPLHILSAKPG